MIPPPKQQNHLSPTQKGQGCENGDHRWPQGEQQEKNADRGRYDRSNPPHMTKLER